MTEPQGRYCLRCPRFADYEVTYRDGRRRVVCKGHLRTDGAAAIQPLRMASRGSRPASMTSGGAGRL